MNQTSNGSILPSSENLFFVCGEGSYSPHTLIAPNRARASVRSNPPPGPPLSALILQAKSHGGVSSRQNCVKLTKQCLILLRILGLQSFQIHKLPSNRRKITNRR